MYFYGLPYQNIINTVIIKYYGSPYQNIINTVIIKY